MSEAFVYMWYVASTGMYYIGYSVKDLDKYTHSSKDEEFCKLVPSSKSSSIVERRDFLKDLPKGVRRRVLARGTKEEMIELEHELLENRKAKCWGRYYNLTTCFPPPPMFGEDHHNFGKKRSEETKRKLSEKLKGRNLSEEHKRNIGEAGKGRTHSEETKRKIGEGNKGKTASEEHKRKIGEGNGKACVSPEGVVYFSTSEAARQTSYSQSAIWGWCTNNKNGWYWKDSPPTNLDNFSA